MGHGADGHGGARIAGGVTGRTLFDLLSEVQCRGRGSGVCDDDDGAGGGGGAGGAGGQRTCSVALLGAHRESASGPSVCCQLRCEERRGMRT